jgi:ZIP family zinc transporter
LPSLGVVIAAAMALHNIPEGIAIALPMYAGGGSRLRAFELALISGLIEPLGALISALLLQNYMEFVPFGLAFAGGVMVFVTMDELIPVAHQHGHEHSTSLGVLIGCVLTFILLTMLQ